MLGGHNIQSVAVGDEAGVVVGARWGRASWGQARSLDGRLRAIAGAGMTESHFLGSLGLPAEQSWRERRAFQP